MSYFDCIWLVATKEMCIVIYKHASDVKTLAVIVIVCGHHCRTPMYGNYVIHIQSGYRSHTCN